MPIFISDLNMLIPVQNKGSDLSLSTTRILPGLGINKLFNQYKEVEDFRNPGIR